MSLDTPLESIVPTVTTGEWLVRVRQELDATIGTALRYDGTPDGAWTYALADLAGSVSEHLQLVVASSLLATAPPPVLVARARDQVLDVQPATYSTFRVTVAGTASAVYVPVGTVFVPDAVASLINAAGETLQINGSEWEVIENEAAGESVITGDELVIQSLTPGYVTIDETAITFRPKTAIQGFGTATWANTDESQIGQNEEQSWQLRQRIAARKAYRFGSPSGMVQTLREIPWVVAVGITEGAGTMQVTVAPAPASTAQTAEWAQALYDVHPVGIALTGAQSATVDRPDGGTFTVNWENGGTDSVTVAFSLTLASGVNETRAIQEAQAAISQVFAELGPGDTIRYLRCIAALNIRGVTGATLTLDGGTADVTPADLADVLVPVFS